MNDGLIKQEESLQLASLITTVFYTTYNNFACFKLITIHSKSVQALRNNVYFSVSVNSETF